MMRRWVRIVLIVIIVLLLILLIGPLLIPVTPLEGTVPPEQLADPDSRFVDINGLQVHYKIAGQGEPTAENLALVLLHGFAASVFSWREVMEPLAESLASEIGTVMAFDRPAFGLTERPLPGEWVGESPYGAENQVELTIGLLDELGVERAILVGNSAGGTIALLTALAYPQRVQALVLVDAAVYAHGGSLGLIRFVANTPQMQRIGPLLARRMRGWGMDFARSAWHDPSKITAEVWEGYLKPLQAEDWDRGLWEMVRASGSHNLEERLAGIRMPCLVITGDDDRIVPTEQSVRLADELPDAELVVIPDCGHIPHEECPEPFLQAVADFLYKLP
jgi:pimeloyl-ACP methyl ester carboxylesterase